MLSEGGFFTCCGQTLFERLETDMDNLTERSSLSSEGCGISGIMLNVSLCPRTVVKDC